MWTFAHKPAGGVTVFDPLPPKDPVPSWNEKLNARWTKVMSGVASLSGRLVDQLKP
jgi:hypothetical protein